MFNIAKHRKSFYIIYGVILETYILYELQIYYKKPKTFSNPPSSIQTLCTILAHVYWAENIEDQQNCSIWV